MVNLRRYFYVEENIGSYICKGYCIHAGKMLKAEANGTSCVLTYQPNAPKDLQKYRRKATCEVFFDIPSDNMSESGGERA